MMLLQLSADSHVIPDYQELEHVPPTGFNLLQDERLRLNNQDHQAIRTIVENVVTEQQQKNVISSAQTAQPTSQQKPLSQAMITLLDQAYLDPALQNDTMAYHFKQLPIREALKIVSSMSPVPLIIDGDVSGFIENLTIDRCTVGTGLSILLSNNTPRLALIKEDNVFRVVTRTTALERLHHKAQKQEYEHYRHAVTTVHHAKWDDRLKKQITDLWKGIIATDESSKQAYLVFDDASKKIVYWGLHAQVETLQHYLKEIDIAVPQVRIDIRVIMASKSFEDSFGVQWSGVYDQGASIKHFNFVGLGPIIDATDASYDFFKNLITWAVNILPPNVATTPALNIPIVFGGKDLNTKRLNLLLNASENKNQIKTLLKPSLLVSSEECAEILVGEELPQETRLDEAIEGKLTNVTTTYYKDVGMKIRVKPVVNAEGTAVFLDVYVENSSVVPRMLSKTSSSNNNQYTGLLDYTIETARSKSQTVLKSGQTTMIGGLMTHVREKDLTGVPWLKDIPLLGWFFKGKRTKFVDKQLMIFITPTVI